jgi:hypothetical protein
MVSGDVRYIGKQLQAGSEQSMIILGRTCLLHGWGKIPPQASGLSEMKITIGMELAS